MANKLFALLGPHGAGKASLIKELMQIGVHYVPLYTTRDEWKDADPDHELMQVVSKDDYMQRAFMAKFTYNGDYYGIDKNDLLTAMRDHSISVTMLDENGAKQLRRFLRVNLVTVFLMTEYVNLIEHLLTRHYNNAEIKDILQYDETNHSFSGWKGADFVIKHTHELPVALIQLLSIMGLTQPVDAATLKKLVG